MALGYASADCDPVGYAPGSFEAVDHAIEAGAEAAFSFLEKLVAAPSTVGHEAQAQEIVAAELERLGFGVAAVPVPPETADAAPGGVAQASYAGRDNVVGRIKPGAGPSLLLNGHIDVVPAEDCAGGRPRPSPPPGRRLADRPRGGGHEGRVRHGPARHRGAARGSCRTRSPGS